MDAALSERAAARAIIRNLEAVCDVLTQAAERNAMRGNTAIANVYWDAVIKHRELIEMLGERLG